METCIIHGFHPFQITDHHIQNTFRFFVWKKLVVLFSGLVTDIRSVDQGFQRFRLFLQKRFCDFIWIVDDDQFYIYVVEFWHRNTPNSNVNPQNVFAIRYQLILKWVFDSFMNLCVPVVAFSMLAQSFFTERYSRFPNLAIS